MKNQFPSLAVLLFANALAFADPPAMITLGASAPDAFGFHASFSRYFSDAAYAQVSAEAGLGRFQSRWASISQAMAGMGMEIESSSHLFYRTTGSLGVGYIQNPGDTGNSRSEWMQVVRISPQMLWYPRGRFSGTSLGLTFGINLEYRSSWNSRPLPERLSGVKSQIMAGLVL